MFLLNRFTVKTLQEKFNRERGDLLLTNNKYSYSSMCITADKKFCKEKLIQHQKLIHL